MTGDPATAWRRWTPAGLALLLTAGLLLVVWHDLPYRSDDSSWYLQMARGEAHDVPAPFAGRLVHTGLARLLVTAGLEPDAAFLAVALPAFWLALAGVAWLHRRGGVPVPVTVLVLAGWFAATLLRDATLPDAHAAAWLAAYAVVASRRPAWAVLLLVGAVACRESLALFALVAAVLAWWAGRRRLALGTLAALVLGLVLVDRLSDAGNVHGLGGPVYLAAKFVFNLSRNVAGWELWVDTIDYCEPTRTWPAPAWLAAGSVGEIGVCGFNPVRPLWLLVAWSGSFGVLPGWLWARRRVVREAWPAAPLWLRTALVYGLLAAFLAPAAGTMLPRLVGYAWPAFWLAVPLLAGPVTGARRPLALLAAGQLAAAWGVPLLAAAQPLNVPVLGTAAALGLVLNMGAARWTGTPGVNATARPAR